MAGLGPSEDRDAEDTSAADAPEVLSVVGTRPEAIKMAPVAIALERAGWRHRLCVTGQHGDLLEPMLKLWRLRADHHLAVMRPRQGLADLTARLLSALGPLLERRRPDAVLVQGDTTSALAGALAAFYAGVPVGHVEAGLRSGRLDAPFPEEANRRLIDSLSRWCFAPTEVARANLAGEGRRHGVFVTGNTVVDAVHDLRRRLDQRPLDRHRRILGPAWPAVAEEDGPLVLVTAHRRESLGAGLDSICRGLRRLATERPAVRWVFPVHPNPAVAETVRARLAGLANVFLIEPVPYDLCLRLVLRSTLVLTDSGGLQEEAPSLGRPVLVMREVSERPEGIDAGVARLVGTDGERMARQVGDLLDDPRALARMANADNPYGDGRAAGRIVAVLADDLG